jgi:hypothetical protein
MSIAVAAENGTLRTGQAARGDFRCTDCGYGVTVRRALPVCPMCRGEDWDAWPSGRPAARPVSLGVR